MELQELLQDIVDGNSTNLISFLENNGDANTVDPRWNCSMIFHAVFSGNFESVKRLVEAGADVNHQAQDPGSDILAATPLALALQCRLMMDHDKYDPIVQYLQENGANEQAILDTPQGN